jgi:hypothetical protein
MKNRTRTNMNPDPGDAIVRHLPRELANDFQHRARQDRRDQLSSLRVIVPALRNADV